MARSRRDQHVPSRPLKTRLELESLEDRRLMASGLTASLTDFQPTTAHTATLAQQPALTVNYQGLFGASESTQAFTRDDLLTLLRLEAVATALTAFMDRMAAEHTAGRDVETLINGTDAAPMTALEAQQAFMSRVWEGVQAELERLGVSGLFGHRIPGAEGGDPFSEFINNGQAGDRLQSLLDRLAPAGTPQRAMADEVLSVPGLEAFKGPDVMTMDPRDGNGLSSTDSGNGGTAGSEGETEEGDWLDIDWDDVADAAEAALEYVTDVVIERFAPEGLPVDLLKGPGVVEDVTGRPADLMDGLRAIFGGQSWGKDQDPEADPKPDPTKYESPDAPIREPVNFDPQTKLDSLQQPGGEEPIDYDMLIDRFVRGLVAHLMSTINPAPDGAGGEGGGDPGIDPGQGPIGGDPPDETPVPVVTGSNGPKPFGDPDSPTGPGGPIPLQMP